MTMSHRRLIETAFADRIQPPHDAEDDTKLAALTEAMEHDGWQGAPIVVIDREDADPLAITGSHRIAAAREVGIDVPTVSLADLLSADTLAALIADYGAAGVDSPEIEAAIHAVGLLSADVVEHYGLDLH